MNADKRGPAPGWTNRPDTLRRVLGAPLDRSTWRASLAIFLGFGIEALAFAFLTGAFSTGGSLLFLLVGVPVIALGIEVCRLVARIERWRMTLVDRRPLRPHLYRTLDAGPFRLTSSWIRQWAEVEFIDENRWRDVIYVVVALPLTMLEFVLIFTLWVTATGLLVSPLVVALLEGVGVRAPDLGVRVDGSVLALAAVLAGLVLAVVASLAARGLMTLHRAVVEGLLCVSEREELRQRVEALKGSRSAALEVEASELRRIERDLHDGAQQRLVLLAIDLGLAADRIDQDPAQAKALVNDARDQARQTLAELRDLVRGTAPAILLDRGLVAALGAVAGHCPVPTTVDSDLPADLRLPHSVERAAYFVAAEALANVAKHSSAEHSEVRCHLEGSRLSVTIEDDGVGGAAIIPAGGLAGLSDRVQSLDGALTLSSPPGGPTRLHVELPIGTA